MSIGSRIEGRGWIDARSLPLPGRLGDRVSERWAVAIAALALFTAVIAVAALVAGEPLVLVFAGSAWLLALALHLWTTADRV